MKDNRSYYDDFAGWYENERHHGYHALLDQMQIEVAGPLCQNREVLEVGCGTGMILKEIDAMATRAVGIDISPGMLEQARARGLDVVEGPPQTYPSLTRALTLSIPSRCSLTLKRFRQRCAKWLVSFAPVVERH